MTKEELKKEAGEWLKNNIKTENREGIIFNIVPTPVQIYCAGAESREKRIAELENKIADIKANCDFAIEGRDIKIKELETENNNLLDVINNQDVKIADLEKKLEQAKEIIKKFLSLRHDCKEKDCPCESLICETIDERAEQFLKEN